MMFGCKETKMNLRSQKEKAELFLSLHTRGDLLVLPNVWNPIGARILEKKGYPAVATASAAISASLGYQDGERIKRATVIDLIERIARSVDVPVTADIETGYGESLSELGVTAQQVIESGVVGVNIEDGLEWGGALRTIDEQCQRIATLRHYEDRRGVHLVINARTDSFVSFSFTNKEEAAEEAVARAKAFSEAGADCFYPIGPGDEATVRLLRARIESPINILGSLGAAIASNCVPCAEFHIAEARKLGLTDSQIVEAVRLGDKVRQVPARKVLRVALALLNETPEATCAGESPNKLASASQEEHPCCH
jgi:AhpD family alkylhydroperoxidase